VAPVFLSAIARHHQHLQLFPLLVFTVMPSFSYNNARYHYETQGAGPAVILHHGFTSNAQAWHYYGYVDALKPHYQVITFDALGHGKSDKPHNIDAYSLDHRTGAVLALLDTLQIEQAHYMGFSLGGWTGFGLVERAPERLASVIIGGAHPNRDASWDVFKGIDGNDADAFIRAFEIVLNENIPNPMRMLIKANDLVALACAAQHPRLGFKDMPAHLRMPCLMFCGTADQRHDAVQHAAQQLAQAEFLSLQGVSHFGGIMYPQLVLPSIQSFLSKVSTKIV
jgi:pimeloyl-ACP methyl ester carboxylesterase